MRHFFLTIALIISAAVCSQTHSVIGKWKTIDDNTGKPIAVVDIFESKGKIYGKVIDIFNPKDRGRICENCDGNDHNKPILGLIVIKGLKKDGNEYSGGKILDPKHGNLYKCYITLESADKLKVRGYIGISILGRTQYWERLK